MILALNTSSFQFSLALLDEDGSLKAEYVMSGGAGRFAGMFPAFEEILSALGFQVRDVSAVAVAIGPGSFTGLRVGLAAAKGFAHALDVPMVGISSLEALACQVIGASTTIVPILDARRGEVFTAPFSPGFPYPERSGPDTCVPFKEIGTFYPGRVIIVGNDYPKQLPLLQAGLAESTLLAPPHLWNLRASTVGFLGLKRLQDQDYDDPETLAPVYLRPPDIRPNPYPVFFQESEQADPDASSPLSQTS
jgi:tRNA threonylcarbamoyladenosine biosynthesis protein TsaB